MTQRSLAIDHVRYVKPIVLEARINRRKLGKMSKNNIECIQFLAISFWKLLQISRSRFRPTDLHGAMIENSHHRLKLTMLTCCSTDTKDHLSWLSVELQVHVSPT